MNGANSNGVRVAVGLSGGVDSAMSAKLLLDAGYEVVGVHLYCWPPKSEIEKDGVSREEWIKKNGCRADEDKQAALKTALELNIPFVTLDFSDEYNKRVVEYFYREYEAGRTPNPDVLCNSEIKFGLFLEWALANNFEYIATGHYAKLDGDDLGLSATSFLENGNVDGSSDPSQPVTRKFFRENADHAKTSLRNLSQKDDGLRPSIRLMIPKDKHKDQTYFLWKLTAKVLSHVIFPLGDFTKPEVREMAKKAGLSVANRPDSQGICFVGNVEAREFLARRLKEKRGEVKNTDGEVVGSHDGVWFYTIGQRGGWDLSSKAQSKYMKNGATPIFYIVSKDAVKNELVVAIGVETKSNKFWLVEENWLLPKELARFVRIRHGGKLIPMTLQANEVTLGEPQRGVAPGQSAVFYSESGEVVGGAVIQ